MPIPSPHLPAHRIGPIRWQLLPRLTGLSAQEQARDWLATELGLPGDALALIRDTHGRPQLGERAYGHDASWSHSGASLLVALGDGVTVGGDLEHQRPRPRAMELAQRFFAPAESDWLRAQPADTRELAFVRLWCAKEAILKAHGRGIAFGLHRFEVGERDSALALRAADPALGTVERWTLHEWQPAPGYRAALAWRSHA